MKLNELVGKHILSGVDTDIAMNKYSEVCNVFRFTLDGVTYEAIEDPSDGYRSYMEELMVTDKTPRFKLPDVPVICHMHDDVRCDILIFRDAENGQIVLEIGTDYVDDYYPECIMNYYPENLFCNEGRGQE